MSDAGSHFSKPIIADTSWAPVFDGGRRALQPLALYLRAGRAGEVAMMMGGPFLAVLFAIPDAGAAKLARGALVLTSIFTLYLHVYLFNAWAGYPHDRLDPKKRHLVTVSGAVSVDRLLVFAWGSLAVAAGMLFAMSTLVGILGVAIAGLWCAYTHPRFGLKQVAVLPTTMHVIHGVASNVLVEGAFGGVALDGAAIGVYFGLVLAGGHLMHELVDRDADRDAGFRTSAIRFGVTPVFRTSILLFTASTIWFCFLGWRGLVPAAAPVILLAVYPPYINACFAAARAGLGVDALLRLRDRYRVLYAIAGMGIAVVTLYARFL